MDRPTPRPFPSVETDSGIYGFRHHIQRRDREGFTPSSLPQKLQCDRHSRREGQFLSSSLMCVDRLQSGKFTDRRQQLAERRRIFYQEPGIGFAENVYQATHQVTPNDSHTLRPTELFTLIPMKHLVIPALVLVALFPLGGLIWRSEDHLTAETFSQFIQPPPRLITNPYHNGYFYLFGLNAAPPRDPAHAGYDLWIETGQDDSGEQEISKVPGSELDLSVSPESLSAQGEGVDPLNEFRNKDSLAQLSNRDHRIYLSRYNKWLTLPFEDWGFGSRAQPRYRDVMSIHRLYIAEGFSLDTLRGVERLGKELLFWRLVLREARTIQTKIFAQVVLTDDLRLLSHILARPDVEKNTLILAAQLTVPLTQPEYSLRWPIRHQLALAAKSRNRSLQSGTRELTSRRSEQDWLAQAANLPPDVFEKIEHPPSRSTFGLPLESAQAGEAYRAYYDIATKASETGTRFFPRMEEVTSTIQRGLAERVLNPHPIEPDWGRFYTTLMGTDARLRLASLQIQLRRASVHTAVPTRLAEVGSQYFDPFSGLPMLWSPTQQKLYSVGEDRLDDGGDPTFDISVPAIIEPSQSAPRGAGLTRNTPRHRR